MQSISKQWRKALAVALLAAGSGLAAHAQDLGQKLPQDPDLVKGTFANGLTYYIRSNKKPANKVELRLVVKAGSILEDNDQLGLAHFMEHMNFNGLQHFQKNELVSYLQSIGVEFGADLNAYTAFDQTVYILPIPTDKPGNLEKGFQILEDWAHNALLTDQDINEERGVVLEESRLGKGAQDRMLKKYLPKYASGTKYADRLPIGKDEVLKTFKPEVIRRFYKNWYRPDLQAVVVVGDIDKDAALKLIKEHFESLANPADERKRGYETATPRSAPEAMVVTDKEATNFSLQLLFPPVPKPVESTIGDYRNNLRRRLAESMINHRLQDLSQGPTPPFPFAGVGFDDLLHGYETFIAYTLTGPDGPQKPLDALAAELLKARDFGFTASELDLAKKELMAGIEKTYNERKTTNSKDYTEEYIRNFLDEEAAPGIANEKDYYDKLVPGITLEEVNSEPKAWMKNMNFFSLITGPERGAAKQPNDAALMAMTKKAFQQKVALNKEEKVSASLMTSMPQKGKVVSQDIEEGLGATTYTLSNGVLVTIKPTDFKSDEIEMKGLKKGGTSSYGVADKQNADFASNVVDAMGVAGFTPTQLEKIMTGKTATVSFDMEELTDYIGGKSSVKDFETMLQLTHLYITQPRKDAPLFEAFKSKSKQQLAFITANPQVAFIDTLTKVVYGGNPLAKTQIPHPADFDKIDLDRALEIYKKEIGDATGYHFYFVGNIAPETALPLIETYLGSLKTTAAKPAYKDNGVRPVPGVRDFRFAKGKDKKALILVQYFGEAPYNEDAALKVEAIAEVLNIKIIEDLREKMGAIYGGGFHAEFKKEPYGRYGFQLALPCGPENVEKLLVAANDEVEKLKKDGPDAKDLDKVKTQWIEKYRSNQKENAYWLGQLQQVTFWGRDKAHVLNYEAWVNALTAKDIQDAANKYFDGKNRFTAVLTPEL